MRTTVLTVTRQQRFLSRTLEMFFLLLFLNEAIIVEARVLAQYDNQSYSIMQLAKYFKHDINWETVKNINKYQIMTSTERRYDIDWLRVIAIFLLLIYHIAIAFQPWGVFIGFIQNDQPLTTLWKAMAFLNIWRIPLLFFVSGMGVGFALKKRNIKQLLVERSRRILLPFLFGMIFIVPLHFLLWQNYYSQDLKYVFSPSHLWFLENLFAYVLILSPLFYYMKKHENGKLTKAVQFIYKSPLGLSLIILPFIAEAVIINPDSFEMYALNFHGFLLGFLAFLFGYSFIIGGSTLWPTLLKWRWLFLGLATVLYCFRVIEFELNSPIFLMAIESNIWIFTLLGFAYKYLNRPSKALNYFSQAVYPIYIIHMVFLFIGSQIVFPIEMPVILKFILTLLFTSISCFLVFEFIIRRIKFIRPLFGLKR